MKRALLPWLFPVLLMIGLLIAATNSPKALGVSAQISTAIFAPVPAATRNSPGFGGDEPGSA